MHRHCIYRACVRCRPTLRFSRSPALFHVSFLCAWAGLSAVHKTSNNLNISTSIVPHPRDRCHLASHRRCFQSDSSQLSSTCPKLSLSCFQTFWRRWHFCSFCPFLGLAPVALLFGRPDFFWNFKNFAFINRLSMILCYFFLVYGGELPRRSDSRRVRRWS